MNPWYALLLGFSFGFIAGSLVFIFVSAFLNYGQAVISESMIEAEMKRRKQEEKENEKRTKND